MGSGMYSTSYSATNDSFVRSNTTRQAMYAKMPMHETFANKSMNKEMSPLNAGIRESRDSDEHPNSLAIIIALDVTGSMGYIPHYLIKEGLPDIMGRIIEAGIKDPQVMLLAIGDHLCDHSPLQIGQFESSDELLDHWLQNIYLEGGGGGNGGESYNLAWLFGAFHTSIDCLEKRGIKGVLFTIGDEPVHRSVSSSSRNRILGQNSQCEFEETSKLLEAAREKYDIFHINMYETYTGGYPSVANGWRELLGDNFLQAGNKEDVAKLIANKIIETTGEKMVAFEKTVVTENGTHVFAETPEEAMENEKSEKEEPLL